MAVKWLHSVWCSLSRRSFCWICRFVGNEHQDVVEATSGPSISMMRCRLSTPQCHGSHGVHGYGYVHHGGIHRYGNGFGKGYGRSTTLLLIMIGVLVSSTVTAISTFETLKYTFIGDGSLTLYSWNDLVILPFLPFLSHPTRLTHFGDIMTAISHPWLAWLKWCK
jgi:hypothetical protein